jgi:acyl-CoA thioesterase
LTWGGIASSFDLHRRKQIVNFSIHSVYLIGIDIDAEQSTPVAVLNTENTISNAYRQCFWGNPIVFAVNASYQLTQEKMACAQS